MQNYLIFISYDGTEYAGYQMQKNAVTVSEKVMQALKSVFGNVEEMHGCSRTDSGVHAYNFGISFKSEKILPPQSVVKALNANLPSDIAVKNCQYVPDDFHARYSAVKKEYIYRIYNGDTRDPFFGKYSFFRPGKLDIDKMNRAAQVLVGKHDFSAFCASGGKTEDRTRTIFHASFEREGDFVVFRICGDGFLYKMVRLIVGTLLYVSDGKLGENEISAVLKSGERPFGFAAPPEGLFLNKVYYED